MDTRVWRFQNCLLVPILLVGSGWDASLLTGSRSTTPLVLAQVVENHSTSFQMWHQGMLNTVKVTLKHELKPDAEPITTEALLNDVHQLLQNYPEENEYWEILNVSITQHLLSKYPQLNYITSTIEVSPRETIPYTCASTVTHWANGHMTEAWRFSIHSIPFQGKVLEAQISYTYQEAAEYPDFLDVYTQFRHHASRLQTDRAYHNFPEQLEQRLAQLLLQDYATIISEVSINLE